MGTVSTLLRIRIRVDVDTRVTQVFDATEVRARTAPHQGECENGKPHYRLNVLGTICQI